MLSFHVNNTKGLTCASLTNKNLPELSRVVHEIRLITLSSLTDVSFDPSDGIRVGRHKRFMS